MPPLDWVTQAGKVDHLLADIEVKLTRKRRKRARARKAALALLVIAALGTWAIPYAQNTNEVRTLAAQRQTLPLQDGSKADLNAQTEIRTDFRYGRRTVRLERGEAFFSVAKDLNHPFLVETPNGTVRVTGTKFNVRLAKDGRPEVTLFEGSVDLQREGRSFLNLLPGQQFDGAKEQVHMLAPAELKNVTAWREGRMVLDGLTLGEAVARISVYHGKKITVVPEVASFQMGGSCALDDLNGFLEFLPRAMSVKVVPVGDGSLRIVAR